MSAYRLLLPEIKTATFQLSVGIPSSGPTCCTERVFIASCQQDFWLSGLGKDKLPYQGVINCICVVWTSSESWHGKDFILLNESCSAIQSKAQGTNKICWARKSVFIKALPHIDVRYLYWGGPEFNNSVSTATAAWVEDLAMVQGKSVVIKGEEGIHLSLPFLPHFQPIYITLGHPAMLLSASCSCCLHRCHTLHRVRIK